jgi:HEPN domain-containing protein
MKKEILIWLKQAERDFKSAKNSLSSGDYYVSALLSQQAVEKALKFLFIKKNGQLLKIHDLVKLARDVSAPLEIIKSCAEINPVYIEIRYPDGDELPADKINKSEAVRIISLTEEILKWIKNQS